MAKIEKATFAAGCFWGVEAAFKLVPGVLETRVGYTGGKVENPTYRQVCTGATGHAEACEITFNPSRISYQELLEVFWYLHDPTQVNRQGNDVGTQYRSAIFYHTPEQERLAIESKERMQGAEVYKGKGPIATEITPASDFWEAERYHQDYIENNPGGYCHVNLMEASGMIARMLQGKMGLSK